MKSISSVGNSDMMRRFSGASNGSFGVIAQHRRHSVTGTTVYATIASDNVDVIPVKHVDTEVAEVHAPVAAQRASYVVDCEKMYEIEPYLQETYCVSNGTFYETDREQRETDGLPLHVNVNEYEDAMFELDSAINRRVSSASVSFFMEKLSSGCAIHDQCDTTDADMHGTSSPSDSSLAFNYSRRKSASTMRYRRSSIATSYCNPYPSMVERIDSFTPVSIASDNSTASFFVRNRDSKGDALLSNVSLHGFENFVITETPISPPSSPSCSTISSFDGSTYDDAASIICSDNASEFAFNSALRYTISRRKSAPPTVIKERMNVLLESMNPFRKTVSEQPDEDVQDDSVSISSPPRRFVSMSDILDNSHGSSLIDSHEFVDTESILPNPIESEALVPQNDNNTCNAGKVEPNADDALWDQHVAKIYQEHSQAFSKPRNARRVSHSGGLICPCCHKTFSRVFQLRSHMRCHEEDRAYACRICDTSFARAHDLRRHELSHSDERCFVCELCDVSFKRKDALKRHERIHLRNI